MEFEGFSLTLNIVVLVGSGDLVIVEVVVQDLSYGLVIFWLVLEPIGWGLVLPYCKLISWMVYLHYL